MFTLGRKGGGHDGEDTEDALIGREDGVRRPRAQAVTVIAFDSSAWVMPSALAPHGQRASTLLSQPVTVCEPPELARKLPESQRSPGVRQL